MKIGLIAAILAAILILSGQNTKTTGPNHSLVREVLAAEQYVLSVFAFHDFNGNGNHDHGEPPIKGIVVSTAGLFGVTGPDGKCELGHLTEGVYDLAVQDPSGKFRYILPSVSEVKPIDNGLGIVVDEDREVMVPLGEGFLTVPTRRRARYKIGNFVDVGDVFNHTFMRDWREKQLTYPGHQGIDFDISDKTVVAAAPGIIIGAERGLQDIGTRVVIYHPNSGESSHNLFLTEYNDLKKLHNSVKPLPFDYNRFKADPWDYINSLDLENLQRVERADTVGYTGYLGRPLHIRLHFECWSTDPRHTKGKPMRIIDPYLALFENDCRKCVFANHLYSLWTVVNDPQYP